MDQCRDRIGANCRRGVVFIDLVITLTLIGIIVLAVVPTLRPDEPMKLVAASTILASDIEYAQSATLSQPNDPTIIRFDVLANRYWIALESEPDTPIDRPGSTNPYEVVFGQGDVDELWGVQFDLIDVTANTIVYDAFGRLTQSDDPHVRIYSDVGEVYVAVRASTGSVSITNTPPESGGEIDPGGDPEGGGIIEGPKGGGGMMSL